MSDQHTKEPWNTNGDPIVFDTTGVVAFTDTRTNLDKVNKANARRIVACVNACAGIDSKYLESPDNLATYARNMAIQRDELLAKLKDITPLANEAMTMFQQQRGMMCQDMAKKLGKPVLAAMRVIKKFENLNHG